MAQKIKNSLKLVVGQDIPFDEMHESDIDSYEFQIDDRCLVVRELWSNKAEIYAACTSVHLPLTATRLMVDFLVESRLKGII